MYLRVDTGGNPGICSDLASIIHGICIPDLASHVPNSILPLFLYLTPPIRLQLGASAHTLFIIHGTVYSYIVEQVCLEII